MRGSKDSSEPWCSDAGPVDTAKSPHFLLCRSRCPAVAEEAERVKTRQSAGKAELRVRKGQELQDSGEARDQKLVHFCLPPALPRSSYEALPWLTSMCLSVKW